MQQSHALVESRVGRFAGDAPGCVQVQRYAGQELAEFVVQLSGEVAALFLLNGEEAAGKVLQAIRGLVQGFLGAGALGDVLVDDYGPDDLSLDVARSEEHTSE